VVEIEQIGGRLVKINQALIGIHGQDSFDHTRQDRFLFVALLENSADPVVKLGGHVIHGIGERSDFFRVRHGQFLAKLTPGEPFGAGFEFNQGATQAARYQQRDTGGKEGDNKTGDPDLGLDTTHNIIDFAHRDRGAHSTDQAVTALHGQRDIDQLGLEGFTESNRVAFAPPQRITKFLAGAMVVHEGGIFLGITKDQTVGRDYRNSRTGGMADIFTERVDWLDARRFGVFGDAPFKQVGQGPQVIVGLVHVEIAKRVRGVPGDRDQRDDGDKQV